MCGSLTYDQHLLAARCAALAPSPHTGPQLLCADPEEVLREDLAWVMLVSY